MGVHSPSCPLGPGATSQGLKCIVAAAKGSPAAGCTLGEASPAALLLELCPVPSTELVPLGPSPATRIQGCRATGAGTLGLDSPLLWVYSTREGPAFVTHRAQQTPPCSTAV